MNPGDVYQPPPGSQRRDDPYAPPAAYPSSPPSHRVGSPFGARPPPPPGGFPHSTSGQSLSTPGYPPAQHQNPFHHPSDSWGGGPTPSPPPVPRPPYGDPLYRTESAASYGTPFVQDTRLHSPPPLLPSHSHSNVNLGYPPPAPSPGYGHIDDDFNDEAPLMSHARPDARMFPSPYHTPYHLQDNGPMPAQGDMGVQFDDPYGNGGLKDEPDEGPRFGPVPTNRVPRRNRTQKRVALFKGHFVYDYPVPSTLLKQCPIREGQEFTHMRYTAVTCDPDDFVDDQYTLRQRLYDPPRHTELFIVVTMYNEDDVLFCRTMRGLMQNIAHLCNRTRSKTWGEDGWKKVTVCIVSDGRAKINERTKAVCAALGVYQDEVMKKSISGKPVTAHLFEYTTQLNISSDHKVGPPGKESVPIQLIFCLKEKNQKKINSHRWFFNAFGKCLNPNVCVLLDVGTQPGTKSIYHLWKAFDINSSVGGACGEIVALKGMFWKNLINPLVAAQNFEYKMSNILDKPLESAFGYISVLPGAFSAYRYLALQNDKMGEGPLQKYFLGETLHGADAGIFKANMYLAEDRILCWELVSKRDSHWTLHYVKSAEGITDVPDAVPELVSQRRRWLNGSFFAALHSIVHFGYLYRSSHSFMRKFFLHIELIYQVINTVFAWFSLGNYYIAFYVLTRSMDQYGVALRWINVILNYVYLALLLVCFILALGNRPAGSKLGYTISMVGFALITVYMIFCAVFLAVRGIQQIQAEKNLSAESIFGSPVFRNIVVSLLATYGLYIISSLLAMDPWHLVTSFVQYLLIAPSYINVLNVYAFSNVHDVSWGTKGSDKASEDLDVVKATGDNEVAIEVSEQNDVEYHYHEALKLLSTKPKPEVQKVNMEQKQDDRYKNFRTNVLIFWTISNGALAALILQWSTGGGTNDSVSGVATTYMGVLLYTVAGLAFFRFLGATIYLIVRLFAGE